MRRDSSRLRWRGPRPGPIAATVTEHRRSLGTSWPESSAPSGTARRGFQWDSGCSASRTGIATAPWRSTSRSRHATLRRCRVFDVIGGDIQKRSASLIRAGGILVTVVGPPEARPADGLAVDFVVESDRAQLSEIVQRVRDGRLRTNIGNVATLDGAVAAFNPTERRKGKTIIRVRP